MWPYGYWYPWRWGWHGYGWSPPHTWPYPSLPREEEIALLEDRARILEAELEGIRRRIETLKKKEQENA